MYYLTGITREECEQQRERLAKKQKKYYELHKRCPKCNETGKGWQTLMDYTIREDEDICDPNDYHCSCGVDR